MSLVPRLRRIAGLNCQEYTDLVVATWELACANYWLATRPAPPVSQGDLSGDAQPIALTSSEVRLIERAAWALPRAAKIVPWRSDCLRQAEAGRRWLLRYGIVAQIRLGARKDAIGKPEMHAWLIVAGIVVAGGDISSYTPFSKSTAE